MQWVGLVVRGGCHRLSGWGLVVRGVLSIQERGLVMQGVGLINVFSFVLAVVIVVVGVLYYWMAQQSFYSFYIFFSTINTTKVII